MEHFCLITFTLSFIFQALTEIPAQLKVIFFNNHTETEKNNQHIVIKKDPKKINK